MSILITLNIVEYYYNKGIKCLNNIDANDFDKYQLNWNYKS